MNHEQVQAIATKHGLGRIHFQFNTAQNTGKQFEVGYVSGKGGTRELFCKRQSHSTPDQFYLCNDFAKLSDADAPAKVQIRHVVVNGVTYLRMEDVASYIREIAATEETDVRNRLNAAADSFIR